MGKLRTMWKKDPGFVVSGGAHVLALVFLVVEFSHPPIVSDPTESIAVEMITTSQLDQIMNGEKTAKLMPKPQRRVDKLADLEDHKPAPPLAEAKKDTPPPPAPEKANDDPGEDTKPPQPVAALPPPRPPEPTPVVPPTPVTPPTPPERPIEKVEQSKPAPPPKPEAAKEPPPPPDAEALAPKPPPRPKIEPKVAKTEPEAKPVPRPPVKEAQVEKPEPPRKPEPPKKSEIAKVEPPKRPDPPKHDTKQTLDQVAKLLDTMKPPKPVVKTRSGNESKEAQAHSDFSPDKISALLDHEAPQRKVSTGRALTQLASLGAPTAHAAQMSPSMMGQLDNWLIDHYRGCWHYFGLGATQTYVPEVKVKMAQDGSLLGEPALLNPPSDPNLRSLADSAIRAVHTCNPMTIPERYKPYYDAWRQRTIRFDPKDLS